jgi:hypothetical protein
MKTFLFVVLFYSSVSVGFAQPLSDKLREGVWKSVFEGESTYLKFDSDNMIWMSLGIPDDMTPLFRYSVDGSTLTINGLREFLCDTIVKGTYTASVNNNALNFTLISDPCTGRSTFFVLGNFTAQQPTSVNEIASENTTMLVPNPASTTLRLVTTSQDNSQRTDIISIINALGTTVLTIPASDVIDVSSLPVGAYTIRGFNGATPFTKPLIISR